LKNIKLLITSALLASTIVSIATATTHNNNQNQNHNQMGQPPHLALELTFEESQKMYQEILKSRSNKKSNKKSNKRIYELVDPQIQTATDAGEKMSQWLKAINATRSENNQLRLTSAGARRGIPIDKPSKYGPTTVQKTLDKLIAEMPESMKDIIFGNKPVTSSKAVSDEDFVKYARTTSGLYQSAVRWTGMQQWLPYYTKNRKRDIRGYYYLKNQTNLDHKLKNFKSLTAQEQAIMSEALDGLCFNYTGDQKKCDKMILHSINTNTLLAAKNKLWPAAEIIWKSYFEISDPRKDVEWKQTAPGVMKVTFKDPKNLEIQNWLKDNIEDEFRRPLKNWNLEMEFIRGNSTTARLEFKPNVTPHVTGGNLVVMDENTPLQEYGVKWTIRHEYGHILRLPDCYVEFYDPKANLMINYQLDTSDLMCSRAGDMNDRIYEELKRVYLK